MTRISGRSEGAGRHSLRKKGKRTPELEKGKKRGEGTVSNWRREKRRKEGASRKEGKVPLGKNRKAFGKNGYPYWGGRGRDVNAAKIKVIRSSIKGRKGVGEPARIY